MDLVVQMQLTDRAAAADMCAADAAFAAALAASCAREEDERTLSLEAASWALAEAIARQEESDAALAARLATMDEYYELVPNDHNVADLHILPTSTPSHHQPNPPWGASWWSAGQVTTPTTPSNGASELMCASGSHPTAKQVGQVGSEGTLSSRPAARPSPVSTCGICLSDKPRSEMLCAGDRPAPSSHAPSTSSAAAAAAGCGHYFCLECMQSYVKGLVQDRKFPPRCATPGCQAVLSHGQVERLLAFKFWDNFQVYCTLEVEASISEQDKLYCPYKDCSNLLVLPDERDGEALDGPTECPHCYRAFCMHCRIPGWHKGLTCDQFQALPLHLRTSDDVALLDLGSQKRWKQCPGCQQMVERAEGCNHIKCRCGCSFCYLCGAKYRSDRPNANNVHGEQACACPLFDVPEDVAEGELRAAPDPVVELARAMAIDQPPFGLAPPRGPLGGQYMPLEAQGPGPRHPVHRPSRNGRLVSVTRCRHSASIYDCPHGRERCWFWHDEDNQDVGWGQDGLIP